LKKLKRVRPEDFDVETLIVAAREGRLYVDERKKSVSKEEIKNDVRAYVARISPLVTRHYSSLIDELWDEIFGNDVLMDLMMPKPKARKCRDYDKYGVMRIVGVLRVKGIYEQRSDPQLQLEQIRAEIKQMRADMNDTLANQNNINEMMRSKIEAISDALMELQSQGKNPLALPEIGYAAIQKRREEEEKK
jgi:hypothetical protein